MTVIYIDSYSMLGGLKRHDTSEENMYNVVFATSFWNSIRLYYITSWQIESHVLIIVPARI